MNTTNTNLLLVAKKGDPEWEKIEHYLTKNKVNYHTTFTASDAFRKMKNIPVDIILSTDKIPKFSSISFLEKIKMIKKDVEVIYLSNKVMLSKAIEVMKEGAYDFHELPIKKKLLMAIIEKAKEKRALFIEKTELEKKIKEKFNFDDIIGRSKAMKDIVGILRSISPKNVNVLITGETGTGKEMIANAIHYNSPRASKPFIKVNCASFNFGVLESELFGHERGSFTGAITKRIGRFELANGGTIFLDEVGDLPYDTQIKLLRVIQEKEFQRVGGNDTIKTDVRILAATNQHLSQLIEQNKFRKDLYYRLNIVNITLPPLRERKDDIPILVSNFIRKFNQEKNYNILGIQKDAMQILINYNWPGNVRELENAVESAMALAEKNIIEAKYLPAFLFLNQSQHSSFYQIPHNFTLQEIEKEILRHTLEKTGGNKVKAAKLLGIGLRTIQRKTKDW